LSHGPPVSDPETAAAFASGSSPSNAIAVSDDTDINGNPSIEIEDVDIDKMLDVNSAIAVEKEIAADTIGSLFAATRNHFFPYVESCTLELVQLLPHYYEGIRKSATSSLLEIVQTFYELSDHQEWQPGAKVVRVYPSFFWKILYLVGSSLSSKYL
jgi:importin-4